MSNFHSTCWRILGTAVEMLHDNDNSHSGMFTRHKWRVNMPNEKIRVFEAEWDGLGKFPSDAKLIRNVEECPERLKEKIRHHYEKVAAAISTGKHLNGYFSDTEKYCDIWNAAVTVVLPEVFNGNLDVSGSAKLNAPLLKRKK